MHNYKDEVICDMAETYHIYDCRQLPARRVAVYICGLHDNSRTKMAMQSQTITIEQTMLTAIFDKLNWLCWTKTKDAQRGINAPESMTDKLLNSNAENADSDVVAFKSSVDFEIARQQIINT